VKYLLKIFAEEHFYYTIEKTKKKIIFQKLTAGIHPLPPVIPGLTRIRFSFIS
jgi:hypothetical protein